MNESEEFDLCLCGRGVLVREKHLDGSLTGSLVCPDCGAETEWVCYP